MKLRFLWLVLLAGSFAFGQRFADKKFYLLDSLELEGLEKVEIGLLKVNLEKYHHSKDFAEKMASLAEISEGSNENAIWPRYNELIP